MDLEVSFKKLDEPAFEVLFKENFTMMCAFARKYVRDLDISKEIVHDVFINLWNKRETIDVNKAVKSYLFTSVHNRCLNFIRDNKKFDRENVEIEKIKSGEHVDRDMMVEAETEAQIKNAIDALPDKCREIFMLSRFDQLKYNEIADKLGISVKTVETQMSRALKFLRERLSDLLVLLVILFWIY